MEIRYAISDIHGNARQFLKLLDHVDPAPDQMVIVGDLVNRGLDAWGVIEEVDQLIDEGCRVVMGNHDVYYNEYVKGRLPRNVMADPAIGGLTTVVSMENAIEKYGNEVLATWERVFDSMVPYIETDTHIFVHAGLDPRIPVMSRQKPEDLYSGLHEWKDPNQQHVFDQVVVFGHTPTYYIHKGILEDEATVWFSRKRKKLALDTGAGFGRRMTMVDLETGRAYAYDMSTNKIVEYQFMNPNKR